MRYWFIFSLFLMGCQSVEIPKYSCQKIDDVQCCRTEGLTWCGDELICEEHGDYSCCTTWDIDGQKLYKSLWCMTKSSTITWVDP